MNWLRKLLGSGKREYRGDGFSVRIDPVVREAVSITYTREGQTLKLSGERVGERWQGINLLLPADVADAQVPQLVRDLEAALIAMGHGYIITRKLGVDTVPEPERQAALAELRAMGFEIEILPDGKIRQSRSESAPRQDADTLKKQAPRMMSLLQSVHGTRPRLETLAKSKEF